MRQPTRPTRRNPWVSMALIALAMPLGLGSRRFGRSLPAPVAAYAGDTLWAFVAFLGIGLLRPRASSCAVAIAALLFSAAVETSQLYHAPWIDAVRHTTLGALVLGQGFLWTDLVCYAAGVALGVLAEGALQRTRGGRPERIAERPRDG